MSTSRLLAWADEVARAPLARAGPQAPLRGRAKRTPKLPAAPPLELLEGRPQRDDLALERGEPLLGRRRRRAGAHARRGVPAPWVGRARDGLRVHGSAGVPQDLGVALLLLPGLPLEAPDLARSTSRSSATPTDARSGK